jgi:hypothetical protein
MNGTFPQGDVHNTGEWTSESLNKINNEKYLTPNIDSSLEAKLQTAKQTVKEQRL